MESAAEAKSSEAIAFKPPLLGAPTQVETFETGISRLKLSPNLSKPVTSSKFWRQEVDSKALFARKGGSATNTMLRFRVRLLKHAKTTKKSRKTGSPVGVPFTGALDNEPASRSPCARLAWSPLALCLSSSHYDRCRSRTVL